MEQAKQTARQEFRDLQEYLASFDDELIVLEDIPDNLKMDADSRKSLAYNIREDYARNVSMRNASMIAAGKTATR